MVSTLKFVLSVLGLQQSPPSFVRQLISYLLRRAFLIYELNIQ